VAQNIRMISMWFFVVFRSGDTREGDDFNGLITTVIA
jgi:hypothetical protein